MVAALHIEHAISDFGVWKNAFEADSARREESGVRRYRVFRPLDGPAYVAIDLDFDTLAEAEAFRSVLQDLWGSRRATPALAGAPQTRIVEEVLSKEY